MSKHGKVIILLALTIMLLCLSGCYSKYCTVPGCPKESARGADYCYQHKCLNFNCTNRAIKDYYYCKSCLERAVK